jgi:hypothetical protein
MVCFRMTKFLDITHRLSLTEKRRFGHVQKNRF